MEINFSDPNFQQLYNKYLDEKEKLCSTQVLNECIEKKSILENYNLKYNNECSKIFENLYLKVAYKEYGIKGENVIRGYYCPSIICDIVVGNIDRGKLIKGKAYRKKPSYEYGFDVSGKLLTVKYLYSSSILYEYLIYEEASVIGVIFSSDNNIKSINKCTFDKLNRIETFSYGYDFYKKTFREFSEEIYSYDSKGIKGVDWRRIFYNDRIPHIDREIYSFFHNSDNQLSEYSVYPRMFPDEKFKIKVKRKI